MIYLFLADGFEEIEAITPLDLLRRAGKKIKTVGVTGKTITSVRGLTVVADIEANEIELNDKLEMIILPGGMPGTENLYVSEKVGEAVSYCAGNDIFIAAICAAPSILGRIGALKGKKATCYPGFEKFLEGADINSEAVVQDGKLITAKGAGASLEFAFKLVEVLCCEEEVRKMRDVMQCL